MIGLVWCTTLHTCDTLEPQPKLIPGHTLTSPYTFVDNNQINTLPLTLPYTHRCVVTSVVFSARLCIPDITGWCKCRGRGVGDSVSVSAAVVVMVCGDNS